MPGTPSTAARSPTTKISGWPGTERSGSTCTRPARSSGAPSDRPSGELATPAAQSTVLRSESFAPSVTPSASIAGDALAQPHRDAEALELQPRLLRKVRRIGRQHAVGAFDQHHARVARIEAAEFAAQGVPRDLGERAGELDAGRAGADDDEGEPLRALRRVGLPLRALEGEQDARADLQRVLERLQPRRVTAPSRRCRNSCASSRSRR